VAISIGKVVWELTVLRTIEMDDKEIDQELNLPVELRDLPAEEKRRLLRFKKRVSEVVYEEDLLQRVDSLSKARDLERLKNMAGIPTAPAPAPVPSKPTRVVAAKKLPPIKKTAPSKKLALSDDDLVSLFHTESLIPSLNLTIFV